MPVASHKETTIKTSSAAIGHKHPRRIILKLALRHPAITQISIKLKQQLTVTIDKLKTIELIEQDIENKVTVS